MDQEESQVERVVDKRIRRRGRESCRGGVTRVGALLQRSVWLHLEEGTVTRGP